MRGSNIVVSDFAARSGKVLGKVGKVAYRHSGILKICGKPLPNFLSPELIPINLGAGTRVFVLCGSGPPVLGPTLQNAVTFYSSKNCHIMGRFETQKY